MSKIFINRWMLLVGVNMLAWCVLSFHQTSNAAPGEPFANAVSQRAEMIAELKEIKTLLKEQNTLLRTGKIRVVVDQ